MKRRRFLAGLTAGTAVGAVSDRLRAAEPGQAEQSSADQATGNDAAKLPLTTSPGTLRGEMLYRQLGRTGEHVSVIGLGGSHIAKPQLQESESIRLIHQAIDRGITFLDNSWDYNQGQSEMRM